MSDLPPELVEFVLYELANNLRRHPASPYFSTIARVCHHWRRHANVHRFKVLDITISSSTRGGASTAQLCQLAELLSSSVWPAGEGVSDYVQELGLSFSMSAQRLGLVMSSRKDSLITILGALFRTPAGSGAPGNYYLNSTQGYTLRLGGTDFQYYLHFEDLDSDVCSAIQDISSSSYLSTLDITHVREAPTALCSSPSLRILNMKNVIFNGKQGSNGRVDLSALQSLSIDTLCITSGLFSRTPPPLLKELNVHMSNYDVRKLLKQIYHFGSVLDSLYMQFDMALPIPYYSLDYTRLSLLTYVSLELTHSIPAFDGDAYMADLSRSVQFLPPDPGPGLDISFVLNIYVVCDAEPKGSTLDLERVGNWINEEPLAAYLRNSRIPHLHVPGSEARVTVDMAVQFKTASGDYASVSGKRKEIYERRMRQRFFRLDNINGVDFSVEIV